LILGIPYAAALYCPFYGPRVLKVKADMGEQGQEAIILFLSRNSKARPKKGETGRAGEELIFDDQIGRG
jgi:hypothetical protein